MEKINFQDNITKANAQTMNQFQSNIENAINSIKGTTIYEFNLTTYEEVAGGWYGIGHNYTSDEIPKGKYLGLFRASFSQPNINGLITIAPYVDTGMFSDGQTIPLYTSTSSSGIVPVILNFSTNATHIFNIYVSTNTEVTINSANIKLIKLGE